jgi:rfaE bifunctional protein nucleotidyltransferase chain/domain
LQAFSGKMEDRRRKLIPAGELAMWRKGDGGPPGETVSMITGTFDMLHPGNLKAVEHAQRLAGHAVVLVRPAPGSSEPGHDQPCLSLEARMEMVSHLRSVSVVTSLSQEQARSCLHSLRPFTWVTTPRHSAEDPLAGILEPLADAVVNLPLLPGCRTGEIREAIRAGRTPISFPEPPPPVDAPDERMENRGKRVTVNGCFDILHPGHMAFLEQARAMGDELLVLVNDDDSVRNFKGATRPVFPLSFRARALQSLTSVSGVCPFSGDNPLGMLSRVKPHIHVKGGSYIEERVREEGALLETWGGRVVCCPMVGDYSTTSYLRGVSRSRASRGPTPIK